MRMQKIYTIGLAVALAALGACKEKGPIISFGGALAEDSTYKLTTPPTPQNHYVLVEEFTGATCTNCPAARELLAEISDANDHRLIVMGIHPNGIGQAKPVEGSRYDFRTEKGTSIKDIYYGDLVGIPAAGFDRVKVDGTSALLKAKWPTAIDARLAKPTPVNIDMTSTYDAATHKADIEVKVTYTEQVTGQQKLSLVIIEDSLIDKQEISGQPIIDNYVFMHTFRDYITAINGDAFLQDMSVKEPGQVFLRRFKNVEINPDYIGENCRVIAFVHYDDGTNTEVLQAAEVHLDGK